MSHLVARTFIVDVTPPLGDYLEGGMYERATDIETPLYLRGLVLDQGATRHVIAAIDYCYLICRSHHRLNDAIAAAAGVSPANATVQSVHTHGSPVIFEENHALLESHVPGLHNETWFANLLSTVRAVIQQTVDGPGIAVSGVASSSHPVHEFASTRRVLDEHNRCSIRWSVCDEPDIRAAPEGKIDPMMDQIVFYDEAGEPCVCVSAYASHPQVGGTYHTISGDTAVPALDVFTKSNPDVFPIYFTGCAGDVTAGKYTTSNGHRNRLAFALKLYDAMQAALDSAPRPEAPGELAWSDHVVPMPLREEPFDEDHCQAVFADPAQSRQDKFLYAWKLMKLLSGCSHYPFRVTRLSIGDIRMLFMPSELCVEYQLYAKRVADGPLLVAAYGDCFLNYVATDEAFDQGGYEVDPMWTEVKQGCEPIIKMAIDHVLAVK